MIDADTLALHRWAIDDVLGGSTRVAELLGGGRTRVCQWRRFGIAHKERLRVLRLVQRRGHGVDELRFLGHAPEAQAAA